MLASPHTYPEDNSLVKKNIAFVTVLSLIYLITSYFLIGFKSDQLILILIFSTCYLASVVTRKFILGFSIFIVYWIIFDYMKAIPNYWFNPVHIKSLYDAEVLFFGVTDGNQSLVPSAYLLKNHQTFTDVMTGIFYLMWIPAPLTFAAYLFYKNRNQFLKFAITFFLVNLIGFTIYYVYPAAPPWYPLQFGFNFDADTTGNTAGLAHFDEFFGTPVFASIYSKSSNIFAAMPSLHASYPLISAYYALKNKSMFLTLFFAFLTAGIWFAAVYSGHHYVLDVLAGIICAVLGIGLFNTLIKNSERFKIFFSGYLKIIS